MVSATDAGTQVSIYEETFDVFYCELDVASDFDHKS